MGKDEDILYDTRFDMFNSRHSKYCRCSYCNSSVVRTHGFNSRPIGENIIKADVILSAWLNYCRESRIYRILEFLKVL